MSNRKGSLLSILLLLVGVVQIACGCGGSGSNNNSSAMLTAVTYSVNPAVYTKNAAITANTPTITGGVATSFVVTPALPEGLNLDATTGVISGTPSVEIPAMDYIVAAMINGGSKTVSVNITVNAVPVVPTITDFTPATGPVGTVVTITGTNLSGATAVRFNGTAAIVLKVVNDTQMTVTVPIDATTGNISITAPGGTAISSGSFTATTPAIHQKLGTNLNWMKDWDPEKLAADLMWQARPWSTGDGNPSTVDKWAPVDSHGWPIFSVLTPFGAIFEMAPWVGTYKLSFTNRQGTNGDTVTSRSGGNNITLTNRQHESSTNITTYDVTVNSFNADQFIWLMWAGSTGGVTDVHLMRPLKDGSGWHAIGTPLSDHIIDRLANFTTIRTMQTGGWDLTSGTDTVWSGRTKPWSSQNPSSDVGRAGGVAIENLIAMANQANKDLWITLPFWADDDYIRKVAQVLRYGSNGITPYTSAHASPEFAPLKPNLNLYVEHGNEIWNSGAGYPANENHTVSNSEIVAKDPHHTTYCTSSSSTWGYSWRRVGWLAVRQSLIFREVFGDAAMMTRVRPILATQHVRYATTSEPLYYVRDVWGQGYNTKVAYGGVNEFGNVAHPVNYYVYALATAPYFPLSNTPLNVSSATAMIDSVIAELNNTASGAILPATIWNYNIATSLGLNYVAYEGGANLIPELMTGGATAATIENARLASYDPIQGARMGANIDAGTGLPLADQSNYIYGRVFAEWAKAGGGLFMHFTLGEAAGGSGTFGLCPPSAQSGSDPRLETGPKWGAIKAYGKEWGQ